MPSWLKQEIYDIYRKHCHQQGSWKASVVSVVLEEEHCHKSGKTKQDWNNLYLWKCHKNLNPAIISKRCKKKTTQNPKQNISSRKEDYFTHMHAHTHAIIHNVYGWYNLGPPEWQVLRRGIKKSSSYGCTGGDFLLLWWADATSVGHKWRGKADVADCSQSLGWLEDRMMESLQSELELAHPPCMDAFICVRDIGNNISGCAGTDTQKQFRLHF